MFNQNPQQNQQQQSKPAFSFGNSSAFKIDKSTDQKDKQTQFAFGAPQTQDNQGNAQQNPFVRQQFGFKPRQPTNNFSSSNAFNFSNVENNANQFINEHQMSQFRGRHNKSTLDRSKQIFELLKDQRPDLKSHTDIPTRYTMEDPYYLVAAFQKKHQQMREQFLSILCSHMLNLQDGTENEYIGLRMGSMLDDILYQIPLKIEIEHRTTVTDLEDRLKLSIMELVDECEYNLRSFKDITSGITISSGISQRRQVTQERADIATLLSYAYKLIVQFRIHQKHQIEMETLKNSGEGIIKNTLNEFDSLISTVNTTQLQEDEFELENEDQASQDQIQPRPTSKVPEEEKKEESISSQQPQQQAYNFSKQPSAQASTDQHKQIFSFTQISTKKDNPLDILSSNRFNFQDNAQGNVLSTQIDSQLPLLQEMEMPNTSESLVQDKQLQSSQNMVNMINIGISSTNDTRNSLQPPKSGGNPFLTTTFQSGSQNNRMTSQRPSSNTSVLMTQEKNVEELESMSAFIIRQ